MRIKKIRPAFKDPRGTITDILDNVDLNSVTRITSKKGVARGNHFHKKTTQWLYLLEGKVRYVSRRGKGKTRSAMMRPGDLACSPPHEAHAVITLEPSTFLVFSKGPRHGKNYEADTFRLETPIATAAPRKKR